MKIVRRRWAILFVLFCLTVQEIQAQTEYSSDNKKAVKSYQEAEALIRQRQFNQAMSELFKAVEKDPLFVEAYLKIAGIFRTMANFESAANYYQKAIDARPSHRLNRGAYLYLGEHYFYEGEYSRSKQLTEGYLTYSNLKPKNEERARFILANAEFAMREVNNPVDFNPVPLPSPMNLYKLQYFPVLTVDNSQIIFTRRLGTGPRHDEDIYTSYRDVNGNWTEPVSVSSNVNSRMNEGTCYISADGKTLIFTSCQDANSFGSCDLYISKKIGDEWMLPSNIGQPVNSSSWESQPSLSADGRTLYFVSNRPGGVGRRDIYVSSVNEANEWQQPINLGDTINTTEDDISPFIHVNGQSLYFASEGHLGFGGLDLYLSEKTPSGWSQPKNLGYPLNNHHDQASLFITADGQKGYYSNEKSDLLQGLVESKIYEFLVPENARVKHISNFLTGKVYDSETKKPLLARIELFELETGELLSVVNSDPVDGSYSIVLTEGGEYGVYTTSKGYLFNNQNFNYIQKKEFEPEVLDIYLDPVKAGLSAVLNNIFFDYDKYDLKEKSITELNEVVRFLTENPDLKIEISGHTDDAGGVAYNRQLSLNRAKAVYEYFVTGGISPQRMTIEGYGAAKPISPNDTEENRAKNRRIEFRIL